MGNKASSDANVTRLERDVQSNRKDIEILNMWPFAALLPRPLNVGDQIVIEGVMAGDAEIFSINLVGDHDPRQKPHNIAYHLKTIFSENRTILNTKHNGVWQEEVESNDLLADLMYVPGEPFEIKMVFIDESFYVYNNNVFHSKFEHRDEIPIEDIKYIQIWEGIEKVTSLQVKFA